ncbi:TadE family type IV pilus minor pilin [Gordonia humi]|uniref:TadE family type IV pilus minor pilin n=1 Tax=Gordonia humi TaxID=686429 RepID=UPI003620E32F
MARLAAAGDSSASEIGRSVAPGGARITVTTGGESITVTVSAEVPMVPMLTVSARAVAAAEPNGVSGETP